MLFFPPLKGGKLPLLSVPLVSSCSLLLPIQIRSPLPDQPRQHLLWEAFQSPPTESPCLPLHSLAFTFLRACYKASHSTKDIFLSCESDCSSPLQKTSQLLPKLSGGLTQPFTTQALPDSLPSPHSCPATHQQCLGAACPDLYLWSQCNCSECPTLKTLYGHLAKLNHFLFPNLSVLSPASRLLYLLSLCPGKLAPSLSAWLTPTHASGFSCSITSSRKSSWNSD